MTDWWSWLRSPEIGILAGFHVFILLTLAADLGIFHQPGHTVSLKEAAFWSGLWVALALAFAWGIWQFWDDWRLGNPGEGSQKAIEFVTGWLVEKSLSVDNLFVFLVVFRYFAVPPQLHHRVLQWGILGALILRATLILAGSALLGAFHWMTYLFGALLLFTAYKILNSGPEEYDPGRNVFLRLASRLFRVHNSYDPPSFFVRREGHWHVTPLLLVLLVIESTDVLFAVDSIPAVFAITRDPFIVYTSNIFAILGLRAMYFLVAHFLDRFRYLNIGLALVLSFVGLKMLLEDVLHDFLLRNGIDPMRQILLSLAVVAGILSGAMIASIWGRKA
jgi:tellurite resistance protein TerC